MAEAPVEYKSAGTFMLIAGIFNLIGGVTATLVGLLLLCYFGCGGLVGGLTTGVGFAMCCCVPCALFPLAAGPAKIWVGWNEFQNSSKVSAGQPIGPEWKLHNQVGLGAGIASFDVISIVLEALMMSTMNKPEIQEYLAANEPPSV